MTDVRELLPLYALGILLVTATVSITFGIRLAGMMSRAIRQLQSAQKRLEQQDYMHCEVGRTGDELEDLAVGFTLSERIAALTTIQGVTVTEQEEGLAVDIQP